jgi:protein SCO1
MPIRVLILGVVVWLLGLEFTTAIAGSSAPVLPDVTVTDQDGVSHRFYSDLVKGKTVAINFVFTSCKTSCPTASALFGAVQHRLQQTAGREVTLLSISVDPTVDRPQQLQAYAAKFGAGSGWKFLTGVPYEIKRLLKGLGADVADKADHSPMILIGNDATGEWTRLYGLASVPQVAAAISSAAGLPTPPSEGTAPASAF